MACRSSFCTGLSKSTTSKHKSVDVSSISNANRAVLPPVTASNGKVNIAYFGKISARAGAEKNYPHKPALLCHLAYFFYYNRIDAGIFHSSLPKISDISIPYAAEIKKQRVCPAAVKQFYAAFLPGLITATSA